MNLKVTILAIFAAVVVGGVGFYWRSKQIIPTPPAGEKQVEVIENPDGSKTFYSYIYNYKISVPKGWEISPVDAGRVDYKIVELRRENREGFFGYINIHSWTKPLGEDIPSYLRSVGRTDSENIPEAPNSQFAGVASYSYRSDARPDSMDLAVTAFENSNIVYIIYTPWEYKDRTEYQSVLEAFEFLK